MPTESAIFLPLNSTDFYIKKKNTPPIHDFEHLNVSLLLDSPHHVCWQLFQHGACTLTANLHTHAQWHVHARRRISTLYSWHSWHATSDLENSSVYIIIQQKFHSCARRASFIYARCLRIITPSTPRGIKYVHESRAACMRLASFAPNRSARARNLICANEPKRIDRRRRWLSELKCEYARVLPRELGKACELDFHDVSDRKLDFEVVWISFLCHSALEEETWDKCQTVLLCGENSLWSG